MKIELQLAGYNIGDYVSDSAADEVNSQIECTHCSVMT